MRRIVTCTLAAAVLASLAPPAAAQQTAPAVQNLIDGLRPEAGQRRGIRLPAAPAEAPGIPAPPLNETTAPPGIAAVTLVVTFATGAATLTPPAEAVLRNLGAALASPDLAGYRFRVEGHTDTVGPEALNQVLSERRALVVRDWLIRHRGIDPRRLEAVGLGEQQLLIPTPDDTPEPRNRRVQVLNLGG